MKDFPRSDIREDLDEEFDREKLSNELVKDYEEEGRSEPESLTSTILNNKLLLPTIIIGVIGFVLYAWYSNNFTISEVDGVSIPLVKADKKPVKVKPDDPGGMEIPNMDKNIYENIAGPSRKKLPSVQKILPQPEEPLDRNNLADTASKTSESTKNKFSEDVAEIKSWERETISLLPPVKEEQTFKEMKEEKEKNGSGNKVKEKTDTKDTIAESKKEIKTSEKKEKAELKPVEKKQEKELTVADIKPVPVVKKKETPPPAPANTHKIQLGAFRSAEEASANWEKIKKAHADILTGLSMHTERADLGKKGIYYRLKAGPVENESAGRALCQKLIDKNQGCFFVKN